VRLNTKSSGNCSLNCIVCCVYGIMPAHSVRYMDMCCGLTCASGLVASCSVLMPPPTNVNIGW
jgi:hypothetical protein